MNTMSRQVISRSNLFENEKISPLLVHKDLATQVVAKSLMQRSIENDKLLPQYPVPAYQDVLRAIKENGLVLKSLEEYFNQESGSVVTLESNFWSRFASSIDTLPTNTEAIYLHTARKFVERHTTSTSTAWATNAFKGNLLRQRKPLCHETLAWLLNSPATDQVDAAARLLYALASLYTSPKTLEIFAPMKKFETKQLSDLFATSRIPGESVDVLKTFPGTKHAAVWCGGRVFKVDIIDSKGEPIPPSTLGISLEKILRAPAKDPKRCTVATWSNLRTRTEWAAQRRRIVEGYPTAMEDLESAITSLALHHSEPASEIAQLNCAKTDPYDVYADKTLGFSVFSAGAIAVRGDHVAADGGTLGLVMAMIDEGLRRAPKTTRSTKEVVILREIDFGNVEDELMSTYQPSPLHSETKFCNYTLLENSKSLEVLRSSRLLNFVLQTAYQNALLNLEDSDIRIVEPTSVRTFAEGRCTANWVMTKESLEFYQGLRVCKPSHELLQLFVKALKKYKRLQKEAREDAPVSWGMMLFANSIQASPETETKAVILKGLSLVTKKNAYFTGSAHGGSVRAAEAFVFQLDQVSLVYLGHATKINVCLTGSGKFQDCLEIIRKGMEESLNAISDLAVAVALSGKQ